MTSFATALVFSLFPRQYWGKWRPHSTVQLEYATIASGLLETVIAAVQFWRGYVQFMGSVPQAEVYDIRLSMGIFLIFTTSYFVKPTSLALLFFIVEGGVRATAAGVVNQVAPTLPLALLAMLQRMLRAARRERRLEPRLPDIVEFSEEGELIIACSHPQQEWRTGVTVAFEDELYDLVLCEEDLPPRRFVYYLHLHPPGEVIRGLRRYEPQKVNPEPTTPSACDAMPAPVPLQPQGTPVPEERG